MNQLRWTGIFLIAVIVASSSVTLAEDISDLDLTFGEQGVALSPGFNSSRDFSGRMMAIQDDGKILMVGLDTPGGDGLRIVRFGGNGRPDDSFGESGVVTSRPDFLEDVRSVALQSDGRFVVTGSTWDGYGPSLPYVVRFESDGSLDPTFAGNVVTPPPNEGFRTAPAVGLSHDLLVLPDDRVLLLFGRGLARYTAEGVPDATFGDDGIVELSAAGLGWPEGSLLIPRSMALQTDGAVVVIGIRSSDSFASKTDVVALRYTSDGSLDPSFGDDGVTTLNRFDRAEGWSVALQADGKIVGGGIIVTDESFPGDGSLLMFRLNPDGSLDATFGGGGFIVFDGNDEIDGRPVAARAIAVQASGHLVVASDWITPTSVPSPVLGPPRAAAILRFNPDGSLDATSGADGVVTVSFGDETIDLGQSVILQPDGRILVGGTSRSEQTASDWFLALARLNQPTAPSSSTTAPTTTQPPPAAAVTLPETGQPLVDDGVAVAVMALMIGLTLTLIARRRGAPR